MRELRLDLGARQHARERRCRRRGLQPLPPIAGRPSHANRATHPYTARMRRPTREPVAHCYSPRPQAMARATQMARKRPACIAMMWVEA